MKHSMVCLLVLGGLAFVAGCEAVSSALGPSRVTVSLANNCDYDVEVELYYGDDQDVVEAILTELGTRIDRTIEPGDTYTFSRDCDDLQAIVIEDADLRIVGGAGPEDDTDVLRDGTDFGCGDTITFTFDCNDIVTDFAITVDVE